MAQRYSITIGNPPRNTASDQTGVRETIGDASIYASTSDIIRLPDNAGVIIGHLFRKSPSFERVRALTPAEGRMVTSTKGWSLISNFWGGYVAVLRDDDENLRVMRDPSGALPCLYRRRPNQICFASDLQTLGITGREFAEVNWNNLAGHIYANDLRDGSTCITGVEELLPGFAIEIGSSVKVGQIWDPWTFASDPDTSSYENITDTLEKVIRGCVTAWAQAFDQALLGVSGGLDSSILASCLSEAQTSWSGLTMATDESEGDERYYARLLMEFLNRPLTEDCHDLDDIDLTKGTSLHLARPNGAAFGQSLDRALRSELKRTNAKAFFTGQGGDNVFCYMLSATPFLDRIMSQGLGLRSLQTLNDICILTGCTYWQALAMAAKRSMCARGYRWTGDTSFLSPSIAFPDDIASRHPWLSPPSGSLVGKGVHISMLLRIQGTMEGFPRTTEATWVAPLLSQPIVETCLRIPSWVWCQGGENRAPARRAFELSLPYRIAHRRTKGGANSFVFDVIDAQRNRLRELLLGGTLAEHRLLDLPAIEDALRPGRAILSPYHLRLSYLAEAENWARHWSDGKRSHLTLGAH